MDFLDSLENSLKSLESQEERDPAALRRQQDRKTETLAAAPWAEKLKSSEYTRQLFEQVAVEGHRMRAKIYMSWLDSVLRLEVRGRWCELRPTADGIKAEFLNINGQAESTDVELSSDPKLLLNQWLG